MRATLAHPDRSALSRGGSRPIGPRPWRRLTVVGTSGTESVQQSLAGTGFDLTTVPPDSVNAIADTQPDALIIVADPGVSSSGLSPWELLQLARRHRELRSIPTILLIVGGTRDGDDAHPDARLGVPDGQSASTRH